MELHSKIFVAGYRGLVGSAIVRRLKESGYTNILVRSHSELDLADQSRVDGFLKQEKPDYIFLSAAKVGGIHANSTYPAEFIFSNLQIQTNVIHSSWLHGVKKLLFLGSSCIYPKMAPQPIREDALLSGPLEPTNQAYAIAKITGIVMCQSYNAQYGTDFVSVMPTNLYGPNDNYHPENSHVLPGLLRRFHEAAKRHDPSVTIWGTGTPKREFLFSDDLADACILVMNKYSGSEIINIGSGQEVTILELASAIKETVGYTGELRFDASKPDGTPRKFLDSSRMMALGWKPATTLREGLKKAYEDFLTRV